jgi:hypothetical protein
MEKGMSLSSNNALIRAFVEDVFNNHNVSAVEKYLDQSRVNMYCYPFVNYGLLCLILTLS